MTKVRHSRLDCNPAALSRRRLADGWQVEMRDSFHLLDGTVRFNEIRRRIPEVTQRMLTNQLQSGQMAWLRHSLCSFPKVEYSLSPTRTKLRASALALSLGDENIQLFVSQTEANHNTRKKHQVKLLTDTYNGCVAKLLRTNLLEELLRQLLQKFG